jgi:hypothetical protein
MVSRATTNRTEAARADKAAIVPPLLPGGERSGGRIESSRVSVVESLIQILICRIFT